MEEKAIKPSIFQGGIGEWKNIGCSENTALILPSGGIWAYSMQIYNANAGTVYNFVCSVAAGGTIILVPTVGKTAYALIWRIQ